MKIVIASPLYPPDIAEPAPYVKELAKRLATRHQITILIFGTLPEKVPGVTIIPISKRLPLLTRITRYIIALLKAAREADVVIVENGASVEFAAGVVALVTRKSFILHVGDTVAEVRARRSVGLSLVGRLARAQARHIVTEMPLKRPEILPFDAKPDAAIAAYEASWEVHLNNLEKLYVR